MTIFKLVILLYEYTFGGSCGLVVLLLYSQTMIDLMWGMDNKVRLTFVRAGDQVSSQCYDVNASFTVFHSQLLVICMV